MLSSVKVLLASLDLRVLTVGQVPQVSLEPLVDQESLADPDNQDCQVRRARRVVTEFQDQLESKESQVSQRTTKFLSYFKLAVFVLLGLLTSTQ